MSYKQQGAIGVAKAIFVYTQAGYDVFTPVSDTCRFDLIVHKNAEMKRVEVKTTASSSNKIYLRTSGGNRSGIGKTRKINTTECDEVFLYNLGLDKFLIVKSSEVEGRTCITI